MLNGILEFFGLVTRSRFVEAYETALTLAREVDVAHGQMSQWEKRLADMTIERDLYKRESAAHAKTAAQVRDTCNNLPICTAYVEPIPIDGKVGKYELRLDISFFGNKSVFAEMRSLAANKRNREKLEAQAKMINTMLIPPSRTKTGSLLHEATAAPVDAVISLGANKPKGFA